MIPEQILKRVPRNDYGIPLDRTRQATTVTSWRETWALGWSAHGVDFFNSTTSRSSMVAFSVRVTKEKKTTVEIRNNSALQSMTICHACVECVVDVAANSEGQQRPPS